jgi:hypothetical protein
LLYLVWFGLRLSKRSIELSIIGVTKPIGIGRRKGAPLWFLSDIQNTVFERIHHVFHEIDKGPITKLSEFPLQYTTRGRELIGTAKKELHRQILELLDQENKTKIEIVDTCKEYSKAEIDEAMRQLRKMKFIFYDRKQNKWCINRDQEVPELNS